MLEREELALQALKDAINDTRHFDGEEPDGWQAYLDRKSDDVKQAFPDYLNNQHVLIPLIQAGAITTDEVKQMSDAMRTDPSVVSAFVVYDPWRCDLSDIVAPYRGDKAFMAMAVEASPKLRLEQEGSIDHTIAEAQQRAGKQTAARDNVPER